MKSLVVIPAVLPGMAVLCYYLRMTLDWSPSWLVGIFAGMPLLLVLMANAVPELIILFLTPFITVWRIYVVISCKLRGLIHPPELRYIRKGSVKKVAIIGGGSSGITAAKEAVQAGFEVVVFEQTSAIGGNWVFRETDAHSSVYRSTVINTSKQLMSYSDFPMPEDTPTYPPHPQIVDYFESYASHFGVTDKIRFNTRVLNVESIDEDRWKITSCSTDADESGMPQAEHAKLRDDNTPSGLAGSDGHKPVVEEYDAVLVCSGHHHVPLWPDFPGQDSFQGHVMHSHSYKDPTSCDKGYDYRGKRVLVVGVGNSGADIAVELSRVTEQLYLSTRSGAWVLPKYVNGVAVDHTFSVKRVEAFALPNFVLQTKFMGKLVNDIMEKKVTGVQGDMHKWGMRPKYGITEAHATVHQDLLHRIGLGSIDVQPNVAKVLEDGVVFEGGKRVQLDAIIYATGYLIRFPFLTKSTLPVDEDNHVRLHKFMFNPRHASTMSYIGYVQPWGAVMPIAELQSRWAMQVLKGERGLPTPEGMERQITERLNEMWKMFIRRPRHTTECLFHTTMESLAEEVGCVPSVLNPRNWKVLKELLLAPAGWPFTYRLQGPGKWDGAADALKTAFAQIGTHP